MQTKIELISNVLRIKKFAIIGIVSGVGLGIIYYFLTMSMLPTHFDTAVELAPHYILTSIGLTIAISTLAGINFAMMAYKMNQIKKMNSVKSNSSAIFGGIFAAFTPGCPACTAPLAVILGAVGGLSLFPMQGLELKFISVGVLVFSIYWITKGLQNKSCCKIG
ncbi:MAG: hypothetical protein HOG44_03565 [Nitrosopumilus sp.]|nr:hypothetical protein [Nitrosopumilus sp.]MBT3686064.1 hypothetical protein [Nitrosopumilus sp.]MBT3924799.1 hypothetical protein [Nitrosopumilus sp.]MBT4216430.1 hypothetical protein [Nitrosopumilus sp.]MBT4551236.1 hypothetical protein [Nitrosopumilus sp.]